MGGLGGVATKLSCQAVALLKEQPQEICEGGRANSNSKIRNNRNYELVSYLHGGENNFHHSFLEVVNKSSSYFIL